ncbi:hypothetical protein THASP1DRAFT_35304 [Thamnocephalis sphaerospora]|uniref:Gamma interferon inducible lysosomal thiol reductase n=1 Tax=Thamnocephalis sphaerospora TaxID=78915 RepID=A0A4P9XJW9_9FUNG|nr:hypothetical protein THASP1DRAFT_35304 [Thamnocephalis sphaerospora]|eukprot:RKP05681.1 hypothetical protein THASP1DRAFT_35304 [Thamnocephalis sphaerospora]
MSGPSIRIYAAYGIDSSGDVDGHASCWPDAALLPSVSSDDKRVPLELFVMARCPDALRCEAVFDSVLSRVGNITSTRLTYIARLVKSHDEQQQENEPVCMHGPFECAAARQQLCVAHHYPQLSTWYRFVRCQNRQFAGIGQSWLAELCATQVGLRYAGPLRDCAEGEQGRALLLASVKRSIAMDVRTSCTVQIDHKSRCVHDGGWRDCPAGHSVQDFVRDLCRAYLRARGLV